MKQCVVLMAEMFKRHVKQYHIAELLNICNRSVSLKLHGLTDWTCDEMFAIKNKWFTDMTLDELFQKS